MRLLFALFGLLLLAIPADAGRDDLMAAIDAGDPRRLEASLAAGADADGEWETPPMAAWLPVYLAAEAGRADLLALLVRFGADIDRRDRNGDRPLDWAARYGETEIVRLLLAAGARPDPEPGQRVPLVEALNGGHSVTAGLLLDAGASAVRADEFDGSALYNAAAGDDVAMAARLLRLGADPAAPGYYFDETPLHAAARRASPGMIARLVAAGTSLEARTTDRQTALHLAATQGRVAAVRALLEAGADPDARDDRCVTPLMAAMAWRPRPDWRTGLDDPALTNRALAGAAGASWSDHAATALVLAGRTGDLDRALATAVWAGYGEVARLLIERGARAVATDDSRHARDDGRSAISGPWVLGGAVNFPGLTMFDLLLANGADVDVQGRDALVAAARAGRTDIVARLLDAGVQADAHDRFGNSAFVVAAVEAQVGVVGLLLAHGAGAAANEAGRSVVEAMTARVDGLVCLAQEREASRAWKPTEHIRGLAADRRRRQRAVLALLGIDAPPAVSAALAVPRLCE